VILIVMTGTFLHVAETCGPGGRLPRKMVGSPLTGLETVTG